MPKFYCGICFLEFDTELTSNAGLDQHLQRKHGIDVRKENGKARLDRDSLKAHRETPP
jgi:hypothetical protein